MIVLALSGRIGSGKTTVANRLASKLGWAHASYGQYVRLEAHNYGLDARRETLQAVGATLIAAGWDSFTAGVLALANWVPGQSVVVEGIRHADALHSLRRVTATTRLVHVHLKIDQGTQRTRLTGAGREGQVAFIPKWEVHSTERQVLFELPQLANILLDATLSTEELVEAVEHHLNDLKDTS